MSFLWCAGQSWSAVGARRLDTYGGGAEADLRDINQYYPTIPGYMMVGSRIIMAIYFIGTVTQTILDYHKKVRFYNKFMLLGGLWMCALPLCFFISLTVPTYTQKKTMFAIQHGTTVVCHFV